jgi:magnesium-transporting ATPase (P-type)
MAIGAFITIITGMVAQGAKWGWLQGVSIYVALFIIVAITSLNDWVKDKQFVRLQSLVKDEDIPVIRGKYGATQSVNIYKLVVGDIILLEAGQRVPADCLLLEAQDFTVDETMYYDDNRKATPKGPAKADEDSGPYSQAGDQPSPFLLSNSLVASGSGVAVVCCVGARSRRGLHEEKLDTTSKTPL